MFAVRIGPARGRRRVLHRNGFCILLKEAAQSGYTIERFYMSSTSNPYWSRDLLGTGRLASGYHTNFRADLGTYDVKLVDSDGDECVVNGVLPSHAYIAARG